MTPPPCLRIALILALLTTPAIAQPPAPPPAAPTPAVKPEALKTDAAVGSTVENLQAASAESTRQAALMDAYAKKADAEGFTQVASLFRAVKRSNEIHKTVIEESLKKLGGAPKPPDKTPLPETKATKDNLAAAMKTAKATKDNTLIVYRRRANEDKNKDADTTFRYIRESYIEHARYMEAALDTLPQTRTGTKDYYVSRVCGYMVEKLDIKKCPVCGSERDKFEKVN
ncbi:MAG: ferritin family protein [Phycisphaerales bacterium]